MNNEQNIPGFTSSLLPTEWLTQDDINFLNCLKDTSQDLSLHLHDNHLVMTIKRKTYRLPLNLSNAKSLVNHLRLSFDDSQKLNPPILKNEKIEKKIQSIANQKNELNKQGWEELVRAINRIKLETHNFHQLSEKILRLEALKSFSTCSFILHLKGQSSAEIFTTSHDTKKNLQIINVKEFNLFFNHIKKSKTKTFQSSSFPYINLPFLGTFLGKEIVSKKYSLVCTLSRNDFLNYTDEEIRDFNSSFNLLQTHIEKIVDEDFANNKISEIRLILKEVPVPITIRSKQELLFSNDTFSGTTPETDIFYTKSLDDLYVMNLYENQELEHYALDTFHFQRISLLGELLNTLRHELSNPLFGMKLGAQLYQTLGENSDDNLIMKEIEKNINRCQSIIEDFSNLYLPNEKQEKIEFKKIISEIFVLAKSELRDIKKVINFNNSDEIILTVPKMFLVQIFFNLVINACQAMKDIAHRKEIIIDVYRSDTYLSVIFSDNGPGITEENMKNIFKPFYTTKNLGTGLGLVLSKNLAKRMGGDLECLPNQNKNGASFKLTLPL